jgi:predicted dehydrogenase
MDTYLAHVQRYEYTFALEMEAFIASVKGGHLLSEDRSADGMDGTMAVAVARAMKLSLDEGRPVSVSVSTD